MKYLLLCVLSLSLLTACQKTEMNGPAVDGKDLAKRFIEPAGGEAAAGVVFNKRGDAVAVTSDGEVLKPCRLPQPDERKTDQTAANVSDAELPLCEGTTNTAIYKISQVTVLQHKGSICITIYTSVDGAVPRAYQKCY